MASDNLFTLTNVDDVAAGLVKIAERRYGGIWHLAANPPLSRSHLADLVLVQSRHSAKMRYERVLAADFPNRGTGWLRSERSLQKLGLKFIDPSVTIARKVALLDGQEKTATVRMLRAVDTACGENQRANQKGYL